MGELIQLGHEVLDLLKVILLIICIVLAPFMARIMLAIVGIHPHTKS